ncbi:MAG TPA: gliding motility-associated C-terminal domain-containing protein, partial [Bacteroidia bacterium]|nr:gliding motility-associated C-terminal domain-containing protein [Bacteroidia bacterium]
FTAGNSTVRLYGNTQQFIRSNNGTFTFFHNLTLLGTGTGPARAKTLLNVGAMSDATGVDSLNDREFATGINSFLVLNPATNAVQNDQTPGNEGFVSSLAPGTFSRATNSTGAYLFPTGSSVALTRYRPVLLTPNAAGSNTYAVRFVNHNPDNDGYLRLVNDGSFCDANDTFYHAILRSFGGDAADITLHYIPATDGSWNGIAQWQNNNQWNDVSTTSQGTAGIFTTQTRAAWGFINPGDPYALTDVRPAAPTLVCPTFCENSSGNLFVASGTNAVAYQWTVPSNAALVSGQGSDSAFVNWTTGAGYVSAVAISPTGCNSFPDSCMPTLFPNPVAFFNDSVLDLWNGQTVFLDSSALATSWSWDFGDGQTSTDQNPYHEYPVAGTYTVTLLVTSADGCLDTMQSIITVTEGVFIPNVFSPNGDGVNDAFVVPGNGLLVYKLEIFDRWGVKIFESEADEIRWDGRSTSGVACADGTYYYVLRAESETTSYSAAGFLTLVGSQK